MMLGISDSTAAWQKQNWVDVNARDPAHRCDKRLERIHTDPTAVARGIHTGAAGS
jgi:hypothetical protein